MMIQTFKKRHMLVILYVVLTLAYYVVSCCQFRRLLSDETNIDETSYFGNIIGLTLAYYVVCCCQFLQLLSDDDTCFQEMSYFGNLGLLHSMLLPISAASVR